MQWIVSIEGNVRSIEELVSSISAHSFAVNTQPAHLLASTL
jgi:hypothetical protein